MTLAILCSGQGRQHPDMFALTGTAPEAADLFVQATRLLGADPRDFVRDESVESMHRNRAGQVLCTLQALAAAAMLGDAMPRRFIVAGYSAGEVAAWGVGGLFTPAETLDLVVRRAEAMDATTPQGDGLLFVRGLSRDEIDRLCVHRNAAIAIVNPGDAFVLGGSRLALNAIAGEAKAMNASRVVDIPVEVASHTPRLAAAATVFREELRAIRPAFPPAAGRRVLCGIDGASVISAEGGLDKLAAQISQTVQWAACLQSCVEAGATAFLEFGPGHALSSMVAGAWHDIPSRALEDFKTPAGLCDWLARHADR